MLNGKNIILGVTGGIAAYKAPLLVRQLRQAGAHVRVVMTESAHEFVTPLTLSTLAGSEVITGMFPRSDAASVEAGTWHIALGEWADVMMIAPATANTIAKLAHGFSDNALSALVLALRCPLIVAPAMDVDMWEHPATKKNVRRLEKYGYIVLPPETGELASGLSGPGRLPDIPVLLSAIEDALAEKKHDLEGKNILVTAGPTHEPIDPVRYIGNRSSGKMGYAIAQAAAARGGNVTLVSGPVSLAAPARVRCIDVETAQQMYDVVLKEERRADVVIMAAAVADFTPASAASQKIKKESRNGTMLTLKLAQTSDILEAVGKKKHGNIVVGFALETENGLPNARKKLARKHLDLIVLNNPLEEGAGFGTDTNIVSIIGSDGAVETLEKMPKSAVAHEILDRVARLLAHASSDA